MKLGKTFHFDSAHYLPEHDKCGDIHGHTYHILVEVSGPMIQGMVMDLHDLSQKVKSLINLLDHKLINQVIPEIYPTCENLTHWFLDQLRHKMPQNIAYLTVRVQEGQGGYAEDTWRI